MITTSSVQCRSNAVDWNVINRAHVHACECWRLEGGRHRTDERHAYHAAKTTPIRGEMERSGHGRGAQHLVRTGHNHSLGANLP